MSCDINFKSQEHLKNLGTAVEVMSVYTDLHRHKFQSRVSTLFPGHCLQSELWFKYCVKKVSCWQKWNSDWCNFLRLQMFSLLFGNISHETYNAAVISRCPGCPVTLQYNPLGFNDYWHNPHHCENYIVMTALQCIIISRWLLSLNLMSSVQDATCGVNL